MVAPTGVLDRRAAVATLLGARGDALVITGLGSPSYDAHAAGDHAANFYLWGAMGGAALVALGVAVAQPTRRVIALTGDGEQLMGMGALATIAAAAPPNLDVFVLDNERYGETGGQHSHTARSIDLAKVAKACGFVHAGELRSTTDVDGLVARSDWAAISGPRLFVLKVSDESVPRSLPARDAVYLKNRFRQHLGHGVN